MRHTETTRPCIAPLYAGTSFEPLWRLIASKNAQIASFKRKRSNFQLSLSTELEKEEENRETSKKVTKSTTRFILKQ